MSPNKESRIKIVMTGKIFFIPVKVVELKAEKYAKNAKY
jgi:hypothetical protein